VKRSRYTEMQIVKIHKEAQADFAVEEQVTALKQFYHWARSKGVITNNPFAKNLFCLAYPHIRIYESLAANTAQRLYDRDVEMSRSLNQSTEQLNSSKYDFHHTVSR